MPDVPAKHRPAGWKSPRERKRNSDKARTAARQANRALPTNSPAWRAMRARQLADHPLCEKCQQAGSAVPAAVVDHRDGNAFDNRTSNLASLCASCHSRKTAQRDGGFGRERAPR